MLDAPCFARNSGATQGRGYLILDPPAADNYGFGEGTQWAAFEKN